MREFTKLGLVVLGMTAMCLAVMESASAQTPRSDSAHGHLMNRIVVAIRTPSTLV